MAQHKVSGFFCAPTAFRAIRQADPHCTYGKKYDISNLRYIFAAGEHLDLETRHWAEKAFERPVLDHWWQTESGSPICAPAMGFRNPDKNPPKDASGKPVPGWNVQVLDDSGSQVDPDELGRIAVKLPLPPGSLTTFWENDEKFGDTYFQTFPDYYDSMDAGSRSEEGWVRVMSRVDDVINVAGHRLSGGALEEAILTQKDVVDCAVIGVDDSLKGAVPVALVVLRQDPSVSEKEVTSEVILAVRRDIGAVAALRIVIPVPKLPKTRSGKITRSTIAAMANNQAYNIPATIEDASVFPSIREALKRHNLGLTGSDPEINQ